MTQFGVNVQVGAEASFSAYTVGGKFSTSYQQQESDFVFLFLAVHFTNLQFGPGLSKVNSIQKLQTKLCLTFSHEQNS
jgi:hypothetical protein